MSNGLFDDIEKERPASKRTYQITGSVPAKSNCYRIVTFKSKDKSKQHSTMAKGKELKQYEKDFSVQWHAYRQRDVISTDFVIEMDVYFQNRRSDLDNSLKVVLDCLQDVKAITNDSLCVELIARKFIDKSCPRVEFDLKEKVAKPHE